MPNFSVWQWCALAFAGVCGGQIFAAYGDFRRMLPKEIPLEKRLRRGWWANLELYQDRDRETARRLIVRHLIWSVLLIANAAFVLWTM